MDKRDFGKVTEEAAAQWYIRQYASRGARLIEQNYWCKGGEIDLVFEETHEGCALPELAFVEVRARTPGGFVDGLESVTAAKRRKMMRAIRWYMLREYWGHADTLRCDVLSWDGRSWEHTENAFGEGSAW